MSVHLFVRSSYSLLDSTVRIRQLIEKAREYGFSSVAITDHNVMFSAAPFSHACEQAGIHPIYGMETDCSYHDQTVPFLLLAKNNQGYSDLMQLSSLIQETQKPCSPEQLIHACTDCFLIAYGEGGWMDAELIHDQKEEVLKKLQIMKQELPPFYMALSYQDSSIWKLKNEWLKRCCQSLQIPTAAVNKIYYLNQEDDVPYQIVCGIRRQTTLQDESLSLIKGRYFLSQPEMKALYDEDDLKRTDEIAAKCQADLKLAKTSLPSYPTPSPLTSAQYLTQLCLAGLKKRENGTMPAEYLKRLKYELSVIIKMHFEDYFLIVWDFIRYARKQGIAVGPGRGSAAGSLVAYCLGITQVDPIHYHLLFERFLNPERISMPDIDTDFPDNRRDEVIQYVCQKYGEDHVANIVTFGTLGARQVLRDIGRVMNISMHDVDELCRLIPNTVRITLSQAMKQSSRLKQIVSAEKKYQTMMKYALQLEGLPRHCSTHAAGIILSSLPLSSVIPTMRLQEGMKTSQFTMEYLEERGLIKMDFLGLRNLTILDEISRMMQKKDPDFSVYHIPLDDEKTYQLICRCDTIGVFQLESEGMKNLLRKLQPHCIQDVTAALALFRPGPMENIPQYLANKADTSRIVYPIPALKPVLEDTYGVMIYQEQIMQTAEIAAGFTLARADVLRRAMSKKKEKDLISLHDEFIRGCLKNGYPKETAESLFETISRFAGYGFNKSHAVAYSLIAYPLAYLKANDPLDFYCALLNSVIGDDEKTAQYIDECRRRGTKVDWPDVNRSENQYLQKDGQILLPLSAVRNVGYHAGEIIIAEREKGQYTDFFDFTARVTAQKISRKVIECLIHAGALDCFRMGRKTLLCGLDDALNYADLVRIDQGGQISINLGLVSKPVLTKMQDSPESVSEDEKDALGFCLGPSPIIALRRRLKINDPGLVSLHAKTGMIQGFALIQNVHTHRTRRGDMMAFLKLSDETGELEMAVMPDLYRQKQQLLQKGTYIRFHAKMSAEGSCMAERIEAVPSQNMEQSL